MRRAIDARRPRGATRYVAAVGSERGRGQRHRIGRRLLLAVVLVPMIALAACSGDDDSAEPTTTTAPPATLRLGALAAPEQQLAAHLYAQGLSLVGHPATVGEPFADRAAQMAALQAGTADLVVDLTGELTAYLAGGSSAAARGLDATLERLDALVEPKGLRALEPAPPARQGARAALSNPVPLIRVAVLSDEIQEVVNSISDTLNADDLRAMVREVRTQARDPEAVAQEWIEQQRGDSPGE
jgi:glycine betaine/choline ABC-type transport system substrate-binding protein